jgi:hypothetical protein
MTWWFSQQLKTECLPIIGFSSELYVQIVLKQGYITIVGTAALSMLSLVLSSHGHRHRHLSDVLL